MHTDTPKATPLLSHLVELRRRLLQTVVFFLGTFIFCYQFSDKIFSFLVHPLTVALQGQIGRRLIYTGLTEAFTTYIKVSMFAAALITFPLLAVQLWLFIAPGLYVVEKRALQPFLVATPLLFLSGAAFAYTLIIPAAWQFFLQFESPQAALPIQLEARVSEYLALVMQLVLAFGVSFLLPVLLILLGRVGVIKANSLGNKRRYAFIIILIVAAIITPPDILSMIGLALPLYLLYEVSIFILFLTEKKKAASFLPPAER